MIKHVLHKTSKPPAIELVKAMISMHGNVTQHVRETVSWVEADTRDLEKERSDISGIRRSEDTEDDPRDHMEHSTKRAHSTSDEQQLRHEDNDDSARATSSNAAEDVTIDSDPVIHVIGHMELPSQDIATVMDGIAEAMTEEEEKEKCSKNATEGNPPHLRHLLLSEAKRRWTTTQAGQK